MSTSNRFLDLGHEIDGIFKEFEQYTKVERIGDALLKLQRCPLQNISPDEGLQAIKASFNTKCINTDQVSKNDKLYASIRIALGKDGFDFKSNLPHSTSIWKKLIKILWPSQMEMLSEEYKLYGNPPNEEELSQQPPPSPALP